MATDYLAKILTARVYDVAEETPLDPAPRLSDRLGHTVLLKREDSQPIFSFKLRGAYNKMVNLDAVSWRRGVVAASAGNHAQGVALASQRLGIPAVIVMPVTTPLMKVEAVGARGVEVILAGDTYDEAEVEAHRIEGKRKLTFVHPFDDPDVIAGQGTIAMELLRQHPDPIDAIFVPVGGGGLIAGVGAYVKRLRPEIRIIGVEPADADAMARSLAVGRRVRLPTVGLFADGVAVRQVGKESFRVARAVIDDVITVDTDDMCAAIKDGFEDTRSILEPAGALGIAGLKAYARTRTAARGSHRPETLVAITTGANVNFDRLRFVAEQAEVGEGREAILAVTIPERPGSFREFCSLIGTRNITEFNYRIADSDAAHVFVGVQVRGRGDIPELVATLEGRGLRAFDLTDDDMAKVHIRHLVGGRSALAEHEILYRFEFPERPGALMRFLEAMAGDWNISLFHYRNHGADYGRVLVGMQVPPGEMVQFRRFLRAVGYPHWEETHNPAYELFLR